MLNADAEKKVETVTEEAQPRQSEDRGFKPLRRKMPAHLTPEERAERDRQIAEEQAHFTPENFPADKPSAQLKQSKRFIGFRSQFIVSIPLPTPEEVTNFSEADVLKYINEHKDELLERFYTSFEYKLVPENQEPETIFIKNCEHKIITGRPATGEELNAVIAMHEAADKEQEQQKEEKK